MSYQTSYIKSTTGGSDLGANSVGYQSGPSISTAILQSIQCRNYRVSFVLDTAARTDVSGNYPRLREIAVIDSLTGDTVKKNKLSYEYFSQTATNPATYERLALKTFNSVNSATGSDSLTYVFKYINEYGTFPAKTTNSIDYWGYCNGDSVGGTICRPTAAPIIVRRSAERIWVTLSERQT